MSNPMRNQDAVRVDVMVAESSMTNEEKKEISRYILKLKESLTNTQNQLDILTSQLDAIRGAMSILKQQTETKDI